MIHNLASITEKKEKLNTRSKPFLKWAGGKSQLLDELLKKTPGSFNNYIEPFIGGGAMFFSLKPENSIISDSNPELINAYRSVAEDVETVIKYLKTFSNTEESFYKIRSMKFKDLDPFYAAARTIYLNRTCYNGLYRVNKSGHFNVPFGKYKNPNLCPEDLLRSSSEILKSAKIINSDYKDILQKYAKKGDFIFLDPPYLPISKYSDFKRYTKEQFYEEDHKDLANEVKRLQKIGCNVLLTNSNHPLVYELYESYDIEVVSTKRNISSKSSTRNGEDLIVKIRPYPNFNIKLVPSSLKNKRYSNYPSTRYMGSKEKILPYIEDIASQFNFNTAIDLFSGSGVVGYMFKTLGKEVYSNDYSYQPNEGFRIISKQKSLWQDTMHIAKSFVFI